MSSLWGICQLLHIGKIHKTINLYFIIPPFYMTLITGLRSAVGKVSDCRSRGHEFVPARSHSFTEIDHEIISTAILLPSADSRRVVVSFVCLI